ncbi:SPFH domain / Band 7 family protein [Candidatus Arcanobacter lacustris]|uniref:SPFH domain / Band 7 family protein n=1 Tax=Candidatus Arcanibacter lacustris TaxID=1607817 RepID=A0A0F5MPW9_9RICK|nr:SPFH domain / Band 7 family protein [Candidatus Arcanobacter lacustris]
MISPFVILLGLIGFVIFLSFFTVEQQSAYLIERFGKFIRVAFPGLNFKIPFIDTISGKVTLRILQLDVKVETKTLDNVFLHMVVSVQFKILPDKIYEAFYTLDDARKQIEAFVFDVVRARVPDIKLDDVFSRKDDIADAVKAELQEVMNDFGYSIIKTLITDIDPDQKVKTAMNEINEAQRLRVAATERGEAEKIIKVKAAEADAQSHILQGEGIAGQRKAIVDGLRESLTDFQKDVNNVNTQDVMNLILIAQYFDTLKEIAKNSNGNTIMIPHSPSSLGDLQQQIRDAIITGNQVK